MRVLVTGHEGYVGAVLVPLLRRLGHEVKGLNTGLFAECSFGDDSAVRSVPATRRDLRDVEAADLEGWEAIAHLGALSNDPLGDLDPELTFAINEAATLRLARLAKEVGVERFEGPDYKRLGHIRRLLDAGRLAPNLRWKVAER
jgi:nucleoside-diphosphate-sugar epimerase